MVKEWPWLFTLPIMKHYDAIALPWRIYVRALPISKALMKHELAHIEQWKRGWYVGFATLYGIYYVWGLLKHRSFWEAYYNNPYEIEAREAEVR